MDCGGKRSATPLSPGDTACNRPPRPPPAKAPSPLRFAGAVQKRPVPAPLPHPHLITPIVPVKGEIACLGFADFRSLERADWEHLA